MKISNNINIPHSPSFKKKAYTDNGNPYDKTNTGKIIGGSVVGAFCLTKFYINRKDLIQTRDFMKIMHEVTGTKNPKRVANITTVICLGFLTLALSGIGALFGGIFDYINNKQKREIADNNALKS